MPKLSKSEVKEELATVEQPVPAAQPVAQSTADQQKKTGIYALFINDETAEVGQTRAPIGNWHVAFCDFSKGQMHGPYMLFVKTSKGQAPLSGFVNIENLRPMAQKLYSDLSKIGWTEPIDPIHLLDGHHKIMSSVLIFSD